MSLATRTFSIVSYCFLAVALWWAGIWLVPLAGEIYILSGADGYRRAVFTVETVHYYYDPGDGDEAGHATYWAMGTVSPGNQIERLSLQGVFEEPPNSKADIEKVVHKGDPFRVLYNPDMTHTMVQGTTPRLLLDKGDVWSQMRSRLKRMASLAFLPLFVSSVMVFLARRFLKSGSLNSATTRPSHKNGDHPAGDTPVSASVPLFRPSLDLPSLLGVRWRCARCGSAPRRGLP